MHTFQLGWHGRTWPGPAVASAIPAQVHFFLLKNYVVIIEQ